MHRDGRAAGGDQVVDEQHTVLRHQCAEPNAHLVRLAEYADRCMASEDEECGGARRTREECGGTRRTREEEEQEEQEEQEEMTMRCRRIPKLRRNQSSAMLHRAGCLSRLC